VIVEPAAEGTQELVEALARLVPQLSRTASVPGAAEVTEIVADPRIVELVARAEAGGPVLGVLTLLLVRIPTGLKGRIEDVVVDGDARGTGVGEALVREAQRLAAEAGVRHVELTSAPSREAANRLYRRLGFEPRETNVYVWRPHESQHHQR
jgi:ribosomal protein S18 acetylase RimI-like enzyme